MTLQNALTKVKSGLKSCQQIMAQGRNSKFRILVGSLALGQLFIILSLFLYANAAANLNQSPKSLNQIAKANLSSSNESDCLPVYLGWFTWGYPCGGGVSGGGVSGGGGPGCDLVDASNTCVNFQFPYNPTPTDPPTSPPPDNSPDDFICQIYPDAEGCPTSRIILCDDNFQNCTDTQPKPAEIVPGCGTYADGTPVSCGPSVIPCWMNDTQPGCATNNGTNNTSTPPPYQQPTTNTGCPAGYSYLDCLWGQPSSTMPTNNQQNNSAQPPIPPPLPPFEYTPVANQPAYYPPLDSTTPPPSPGYQPNNQSYYPTPVPPPLPPFYYYPIVNEPAYKPLDLTPTQSKPSLIQKLKKIRDKALGYIFPGGGE